MAAEVPVAGATRPRPPDDDRAMAQDRPAQPRAAEAHNESTTDATPPPSSTTKLGSSVALGASFHDKLGPTPVPDEAADVEAMVGGHSEYSDLPEPRKDLLRQAVRRLVAKLQQQKQQKQQKSAAPARPASSSEVQPLPDAVYRKAARIFSDESGGGHGGGIARKSEMLGAYRELRYRGEVAEAVPELEATLVKKRGKTHSGVLVVTVLMGPSRFSCPKNCHYCPDQPGIARSYLLREPGVLRGFRNGWDPVLQFVDRASALENNGHVVDKVELLILGGTFSFYPKDYCDEFIAGLFYAANTYGDAAPRRAPKGLQEEIRSNETAAVRIIGLTIETRPDYITSAELRRFRELAVTRVQIGIQHLDDEVLRVVNRECPTSKTIVAVQRLLDAGFKVDAHWMPDLPGSTYEKDLDMFRFLLSAENESVQVDQWKVYPTMTVPYTKIKEWYDAGTYKPYAEEQNGDLMVKLMLFILKECPYRIRLNRIARDIPNTYIQGGEKRVNLRQILDGEMRRRGIVCRDVRERECKGAPLDRHEASLFVDEFRASHGTEFYVSIENANRTALYGHLRLRLRDDPVAGSIVPALRGAALVRELHTYGRLVAVDTSNSGAGESQHAGIGSQLMQAAEAIARQHGFRSCAVIAGVGVRGYYAKLGYTLEDTYMVKRFGGTSMLQRLGSVFAPSAFWGTA